MINLLLSILFLGCVVLIVKLWRDRNFYLAEYLEVESKAKFWENQFKNFSKDEVINKEIILRKKYERLYYEACETIDKLKDGRSNNGTKHKQRTSKGKQPKDDGKQILKPKPTISKGTKEEKGVLGQGKV